MLFGPDLWWSAPATDGGGLPCRPVHNHHPVLSHKRLHRLQCCCCAVAGSGSVCPILDETKLNTLSLIPQRAALTGCKTASDTVRCIPAEALKVLVRHLYLDEIMGVLDPYMPRQQ